LLIFNKETGEEALFIFLSQRKCKYFI